jgi:hypothetical protein
MRELVPTRTLVLYDGLTLKLCKMYGVDWKLSAAGLVQEGELDSLSGGKTISDVAFWGIL